MHRDHGMSSNHYVSPKNESYEDDANGHYEERAERARQGGHEVDLQELGAACAGPSNVVTPALAREDTLVQQHGLERRKACRESCCRTHRQARAHNQRNP